jgi:triacylglycerol lipase
MGGPISRKAILGGKCVDTGEDLGPPLTSTVHAYLSVAGVQRSTTACGVHCGSNCGGLMMNDINAQ